MALSKKRVSYLLDVYTNRKATPDEKQELFKWLEKGNAHLVREHIVKLVNDYNANELVPAVDWERLYQQIVEEKNAQPIESKIKRIAWLRWAAAAAVFLFLTIGYYYFNPSKQQENAAIITHRKTNDIAPPTSANAVLTLSNGQKIILDSTGNGIVAMQGTVNVVKTTNGEIIYRGSSKEVEFNTLSNPRGSQVVSLVLADGSKVWLNAASSLKYPTAFVGSERKVEVSGEAYFEVVHNANMPFIVSKGKTSVQVLGTHFNVNAYDDEKSINVTLLEGSVKVIKGNKSVLISPGQQAVIDDSRLTINDNVDVDDVMAWKNGFFSYKGDGIETIMRQVSRWYNVDVAFEKPVEEKFYAQVSRNTDVSNLLKMLEATKAVHFKIEGKTITVSP